MWAGNTPPDYSNLGPLDLPLRPIHIRYPFTEVELGIFFRGYAFDLEEGGVGTGVALGAFVAKNAAFGVESS